MTHKETEELIAKFLNAETTLEEEKRLALEVSRSGVPKEWKIILTLENGAEVLMQVYDIKGQMERLAMILEHCRATHRAPRSINVIPRINPTVTYADAEPAKSPSR